MKYVIQHNTLPDFWCAPPGQFPKEIQKRLGRKRDEQSYFQARLDWAYRYTKKQAQQAIREMTGARNVKILLVEEVLIREVMES